MPFRTQRRVEFRDTDAAGIAHFSVFFPMMEAAEHEMLRSLGIKVLPSHEQMRGHSDAFPAVTWPRIAAACDYAAAVFFEDLLTISVQVAHIGNSSVRYEFDFRRGEQPIASGALTTVCCRLREGGLLEKLTVPDEIRQRLAQYS